MTNIAITIGVQEYQFFPPLKYTANDAKKMRDFLLEEAGFDYVFYFSDDSPKINGALTRPTRSNLEYLLENEVKKLSLKAGDDLWFFFSGHGCRPNNIDYLIPIDGHSNVERSGISVVYIIQQLQNSGADNIVLILDACRNKGDGGKGGEGVGKQTEQEAREKGIITIFSCSPNELSWELEELEQGVFTYALLEGLGSKGKRATVEKLNKYLRHRVQELSQKKGKRQTPRIIADPIEKSHLILMPEYATKNDVSILKNDAYRAQINGDLKLARQLWVRVLEVGLDIDAVEALEKIAIAVYKQTPQYFPSPQLDNLESFSVSEVQQESATEVLEDLTNIINISIEERLGDKKLPVIESDITEVKSSFTFEVVKVNYSGSIVNRSQGSATQKIEDLGNGVSLEMVKIPGGSFLMGSSDKEAERFDDEGPQHYVDVPEFLMGKYAVTQGQWKAIASRTDLKVELDLELDPSHFKEPYKDIDRWNRPVEGVNWFEAVEFCQRLSKLTGRNYRLPSEAEWEYACRAGTTTPFYFGETITTELVNYCSKNTYGNGPKGEYREQTTPVGQFPANAFGLYDMHGNVWEWCDDEWHDNYAGAPIDGSFWSNGDKNKSSLRGGCWANHPNYCRSAIRHYYYTRDDLNINFGFRVVCDGGRTL
jgi:formylglycine-generating enzyme required for sulfatase activity/uncharacterized caspase-like protein